MRIFRSFVLVLALGVSSLAVGVGSPAGATPPPAGTALVNADTVSGGSSSLEAQAAAAAGLTVTVVSGAEWDAMTAAQFATYQVLIAGDPNCAQVADSFTSNESTWAPVVMGVGGGRTLAGNRVVIGTDPSYHSGFNPGAVTLINDGVAFAGSQPGRTGLYFDASCGGPYGQAATILSTLSSISTGTGNWTENDNPPCGGNVAKIASTPTFDSLHSSDLAGWSCSVHESFPTFPSDWHPLAVATDTDTAPTCGTDSDTAATACGQAYVLIAGSDIVVTSPDLTVLPATGSDPSGGSHTVTATVTRSGAAVPGATVTFTVSGVNTGVAGTCSAAADCTTDSSGQVSFTYPDTNGSGDDTITASFTDAVSGSLESATASEQWTNASQTITVTPDAQTITYGDTNPAYTWTTTSTGTDTLTTSPTCDVAGTPSVAGSYPISCSGATAPAGDTIVYDTGTLNIAPAPVLVTADNQSAVYGAGDPTYTSSTSGLLGSDTLTTQASCSVSGAHANVGSSYPITCTGADAGSNYTISYQDATLSVTKAPVVLTADNQSAVYGSADPTFTSNTTGLLGGDTLTTPATCTVTGAHANVGTYPITCSSADAGGNYSISYQDGTLSVTAKPITITADSFSIIYGQPAPTFTSTTGGLEPGDSLTSPATCSIASAHTKAAAYPITCAGADAGANYTISYTPGTFTIASKSGVVTADNQTRPYGSADPALTSTTNGLLGDDTLATPASCAATGSHSVVGAYPIICTTADAGANYSISYQPGTLAVTKAVLTVRATSYIRHFGAANPAFEATISGYVNGDPASVVSGKPALSTTTNKATHPGTYPITATQGSLSAANYTFAFVPGTLRITKAAVKISTKSTTTVHRYRKYPFGYRFTTKVTNATTGAPVPGSVVSIKTGGITLCKATTNNRGIATCTNKNPIYVYWVLPYTATTGPTTDYKRGRGNAVIYAFCTHQTSGSPQARADVMEDCLDGRTD